MCGRVYIPDSTSIEREWKVGRGNSDPFAARYDVAPQHGSADSYVPVVRATENAGVEQLRMQWSLLPFWSKEPRVKCSTYNDAAPTTRGVNTVATAARFREPFRKR